MSKFLAPVSSVAFNGNVHQDSYAPRIAALMRSLLDNGMKVSARSSFLNYLRSLGEVPEEVSGADSLSPLTDLVISVGGDGTFIRTARWAGASRVPIIGVNTGHLGFLANFSIDDPLTLLDTLMSGTSTLEHRSLLQLHCDCTPEGFCTYALNEVAVLKGDTASMIATRVSVDGEFLTEYRADGLIVATPTGSTAYNLSAGGPIMQPSLRCAVLAPVAPHSLTMRPIVIDIDSTLEFTVSSRSGDFRVSVDGNSFTAPCGARLRVERAPYEILTVRRKGDTFAETLRNKLLWGRH